MSVRFPDLQVILPRSVEVGRLAAVASQGVQQDQEVLAQERLARLAEAQRKVTQAAERELRVDPDGSQDDATYEGSARRRARRLAPPDGREGPSNPPSGAGPLGQRVDVRV